MGFYKPTILLIEKELLETTNKQVQSKRKQEISHVKLLSLVKKFLLHQTGIQTSGSSVSNIMDTDLSVSTFVIFLP